MGHLRHWHLGVFIVPIVFGALMAPTSIRSSACLPMYGVVLVSLIGMDRTAGHGAEVMGRKGRAFHLHVQAPQFNQGKP